MAMPKQTDPQFNLRLPQAVKDQIVISARANNRTLTAEIIYQLSKAYNVPAPILAGAKCSSCRFLSTGEFSGICQRFPPTPNDETYVAEGWWCGEYQPKAVA